MSTSSQEAFPASLIPQQESDSEKMTSATCGLKCLESYEKLPLVSSWAKMFADSLVGMGAWSSRRCVLTWRLKGTKYGRAYFLLQASALPTEETESSLSQSMLPTPNSFDWNTARSQETLELAKKRHGNALQDTLRQRAKTGILPTPTARCFNAGTEKERPEGQPTRASELNHLVSQDAGKSSQLNPRFVGEMMGFPVNWTELPFLSGEKNL